MVLSNLPGCVAVVVGQHFKMTTHNNLKRILESSLDWKDDCRRFFAPRPAILASILGRCVLGLLPGRADAQEEQTLSLLTSRSFTVAGGGLAFPFQRFNPQLGELRRVSVQGNTVLSASGVAYASATGSDYNVGLQFDLNVMPTPGGIALSNPWQYVAPTAGVGPSADSNLDSLPVAFGAVQTFSFQIDQAAAAAGVAPVAWTEILAGSAISPALVFADFETFTAPGAGLGSAMTIQQTVTTQGNVVMNPAPIFAGMMMVQYDYLPADLGDNLVEDGKFDQGLQEWESSGPGAADTVTDQVGEGNTAARLTTSSPITLSQLVDTPPGPYRIQFDWGFRTATGSLEVKLGDQVVATLPSPLEQDFGGDGPVQFSRFTTDVTEESLQGLSEVPFQLHLTGESGSQLLLDNVLLAPTSDPQTPPQDPEISVQEGAIEVTWPVEPPAQLQRSRGMIEWEDVAVSPESEGAVNSVTLPVSENPMFFRLAY